MMEVCQNALLSKSKHKLLKSESEKEISQVPTTGRTSRHGEYLDATPLGNCWLQDARHEDVLEKEDEKFQRNSERCKSRTRCEAKDDDVGTECASSSPLYVPSSSSPLNVQPICQSSLELHQPFINVVCC